MTLNFSTNSTIINDDISEYLRLFSNTNDTNFFTNSTINNDNISEYL
jgi:hypothetical protein